MPWDIDGPQPAIVELADAGEFTGQVLDVGCGPGDNAIFLASRGMGVTGLDCAPSAVNEARARATAKGVHVTFDLADATELTGYEDAFDTVLDSALYHCLTEEERHQYVSALTRSTRPDARLHLLCFSTEGPQIVPARHLVSETNLRETLRRDWAIERLELAPYTMACTPNGLHASIQAIQGVEIPMSQFDAIDTDSFGRALVPVWQLTAVRSVV
jgi:ubiquinone/menaquinone biosynthesis C-methylase UbiE